MSTTQQDAQPPVKHADPTSKTDGGVRVEVSNYHPTVHIVKEAGANTEFTSLVHLEAPQLPAEAQEEDRKPLQVSAVLDVSGSMSGEKLALAKEALAFLVSELGPKDKFGLVSFGSDVVEEQRPTAMNATGKHSLTSTVEGLRTRGCTNLSGGLFTGIAQASGDGSSPAPVPVTAPRPSRMQTGTAMQQTANANSNANASPSFFSRIKQSMFGSTPQEAVVGEVVKTKTTEESTSITFAGQKPNTNDDRQRRVVLLFTDGEANEGIQGVEQLSAATSQKLAEQPHDVTVFTFGFGGDHDATLLRRLAECSEGSYYYIESARDMKEIFADCLGGLMSIVAEKIRIDVAPLATPALPCRIAKVATHFPVEQGPDGSFTVKVKDLYAEEKRDVLVTLAVDTAKCEVGQELPLAKVGLTYQDPTSNGTTVKKESMISTTVAAGGLYSGSVDERVDEQLARYKAVEAMKTAQRLADDGDFSQANVFLQQQLDETEGMRCANTAMGKGLTEELRSAMKDASSAAHWNSVGQKKMAMKQSAHAQQRSNAIDMEEQACAMYETSAKSRMKAKSAGFSLRK